MPTIPRRDALISIARLKHLMHEHEHTSTDPYEKQEAHIRLRLHSYLSRDENVSQIEFSDPFTHVGKHCLFDALILSAGTWFFIEAKERRDKSDRWPSWLIEEVKAKELEWLASESESPALFATLTDDALLIWSISGTHATGETTCARKSFEPALGRIKKVMRYYPTNTAQVLR